MQSHPFSRCLLLSIALFCSPFNPGVVAAGPGFRNVVDLSGARVDPFADPSAKAVVLIFVSIDCPICSRYAPEIQRLESNFRKQGVVFWLVQPDTGETVEKTQAYLKEFGYPFGVLRDPKHELVKLSRARVTPEAAVFKPGGELVYNGRIDDRYVDFGKTRPAPTQHDLKAVLEAVLAGRTPSVSNTPATGCSISPP